MPLGQEGVHTDQRQRAVVLPALVVQALVLDLRTLVHLVHRAQHAAGGAIPGKSRRSEDYDDVRRTASSASRTGRLSISDPIGTGSELSPVQLVDLLPNKGRGFVDLLMHPLMHACCGGLFDGVACNLTTQTRIMVRKGDTRRNTNCSTAFIPELRRG